MELACFWTPQCGLHSGRRIGELADPGASMAANRVMGHLPGSMEPGEATVCEPHPHSLPNCSEAGWGGKLTVERFADC